MNIEKFYRTFTYDRKLAAEFAKRVKDQDYIDYVVETMNEEERTFVEKLKKIHPMNGYYEVDYDEEKYESLINNAILLKGEQDGGVIHTRAVTELSRGMKRLEQGKGPNQTYPLGDDFIDLALSIEYPSLLSGLPLDMLKMIADNLGYDAELKDEKGYAEELSVLLTNEEVLSEILSALPEKEYDIFMDHVEQEKNSVNISGGMGIFVLLGLIVPVAETRGVLHPEIIEAVRQVGDAVFEKRELESEDDVIGIDVDDNVNALKLRVKLMGAHTPIWREIVVPLDLNFYELHLVIQEAMGWQSSHLASFEDEKHDISVYTEFIDNDFPLSDDREELVASETGIHPLLTSQGGISYIYDFGDYWVHDIEVLEHLAADDAITPHVIRHRGPSPIEDSGGIHGFAEIYNIIKDKNHPEHEETLLWAKSVNYKERYPKKSINRSLEKMFEKRKPITETNDPMLVGMDDEFDEMPSHEGIVDMVDTYFSELYSGEKSAEDYVEANKKYATNLDELSALAERMTDREIEAFARMMERELENRELYFCYGMTDDFDTLKEALVILPTGGVTYARGVMHSSVADPLYSILTSVGNPRHPGRRHVKEYRLKDELVPWIDFTMTMEDIKFHLKNIGYRGYSKYKKKELVEKYAEVITSKEWVTRILESVHPVELLFLYKKIQEDEFPFWALEEPFTELYESGLIFYAMYGGFYMHPDVTATVEKVDMDGIIEEHIRSGRLKLE